MRNPARAAGVTLIEIMIVLAIIGLVMGVLVGPKVMEAWREARIKTAWILVRAYADAYTQWHAANEAECPRGFADLGRYVNKQDPKDPWGTPLVMRCGDGVTFGVVSAGPDRKLTTDDDVHSWDEKPPVPGS